MSCPTLKMNRFPEKAKFSDCFWPRVALRSTDWMRSLGTVSDDSDKFGGASVEKTPDDAGTREPDAVGEAVFGAADSVEAGATLLVGSEWEVAEAAAVGVAAV